MSHILHGQPRHGIASMSTVKYWFTVLLAWHLVCGGWWVSYAAPVNNLPGGQATLDPVTLKGGVSITGRVNLVPDNRPVSIHMRDADVRDVLNMLAAQGGLNIIVDESVTGTVTVDLSNLPINKAFEYLFAVAELDYSQDGRNIIVATKQASTTKNLNAHTFKTIPVRFKDANLLASQLNTTLFRVPRPGGSSSAIASADFDSNSLIVVGTDMDVQMAQQALKTLDVPRPKKVYTIKYNSPAYIATMLAANLFGFAGMNGQAAGGQQPGQVGGQQPGQVGAGGAAAGAGGAVGGAVGGAGGGAVAGGAAPAAAPAGGGGAPQNAGGGQGGTFTAGGVTFIPEPLNGTLTVMGPLEAMAQIDAIIDKMDVRRPQVNIEVALVELQKSDIKRLVPQFGSFSPGQFRFSLLPTSGDSSSILNWARTAQTANVPFLNSFSLENQVQKIKGRVLANPNVVALDNTQSSISITDQVPTIQQTTTIPASGSPVITTSITTQEAGINLTVTPHITNDGSVTLSMNPSVSQPVRLIQVAGASTFLISSRTINLSQVRVKDHQTLVIGGLVKDTQSLDLREVPFLSNLPVVGAMFRAMPNNQKDHTELVLMVTPHIIREEATPFLPREGSYTGQYTGQTVPTQFTNPTVNPGVNPGGPLVRPTLPINSYPPLQSKASR
jgi:type II secretory pathway component GspD/PulD (secretin)